MGKVVGKGRKHPEAAVRMNFLHQAAACVLNSTGNKVKLQQLIIIVEHYINIINIVKH